MDSQKLSARIEALERPDRGIDAEIHFAICEGVGCGMTQDAPRYTASLDAAMSLVPRGWSIGLGDLRGRDPMVWRAHLRDHNDLDAMKRKWFEGHAPTPALALCAAALKARGL